jgi:hypothetical protein
VQGVNLTDEELWRAIAENTNAMSTLVQEQLGLDEYIPNDPEKRVELMRSHLQTINKYEREYQEYTAELRRRYG